MTGGRDPADVYRTLAPVVRAYVFAHGAREPDDVVGEVFASVVRDVHRFRGDDAALRAWVITIARNRVIDDARRRARRPAVPVADPPDAVVHEPDPDGPDPALAAALARLTPEQREVLALRFVADLPLAEVARITRRRAGAVKALQHRALEQLRKAVSDPR